MPYILVRGNLQYNYDNDSWGVLVSGLKASDIEQLSQLGYGGHLDNLTVKYLQHPCVVLTALEVLGYKVVASSSSTSNQAGKHDEYMWTMRKDFSEPEPVPVTKAAGSQERTTSVHQRKSHTPRRISQWPLLSMRTSGYSPLQSKIYQEQLLERRALRRVAEMELRRSTLELERCQWEYERDKAQTEVRWAHETRMMQLKEERERQTIEQNRTRTISHVV